MIITPSTKEGNVGLTYFVWSYF